MPPSTHYGGTLPSPMGTVATAMRKIAPATQRKNEKYILNLLNTQGNDLQDMNGEGTFFTALLSESGNQQVKIFLINGARNSKDWPNLSH